MRMHTCMHLLCSVIDGGVTGGSIGDGKGRIDFDLPVVDLDREAIAAEINRRIEENIPVSSSWISDEEMAANMDMVRTMSVKPPSGQGRVRLLSAAPHRAAASCSAWVGVSRIPISSAANILG